MYKFKPAKREEFIMRSSYVANSVFNLTDEIWKIVDRFQNQVGFSAKYDKDSNTMNIVLDSGYLKDKYDSITKEISALQSRVNTGNTSSITISVKDPEKLNKKSFENN